MALEVVLIDDDPFIGPMLQVFVRKKGHVLALASNGSDGLAMVERGRFDLVLLDLHLPDLSGLEVLARLNDGRPMPPVIVITGDGASPELAVAAVRQGAVGVLGKPFQPEDLWGEICRVLGLTDE